MPSYRPPLTDIRFTLEHVLDLPSLLEAEAFAELDTDTVFGAVEEAARFFTGVVEPLEVIGDQQGTKLLEDGTVKTPDGWADAYQKMVAAGWGALVFDPAYGGGGFPETIGIVLQEFMVSCNMSFSLCPLLGQGAIHAIESVADEMIVEKYLSKLVTGEWTGTMNLTEPDAGSDVGALRTKAEPVGDGSYKITGQKIFITYGDHDMTDNIVHLVLAKTPGAPAGTKGISCFVVPKVMVNDDGSLGEPNDVRCVAVEHKMGIHASPTCVMSYGDNDGAIGWLLGNEFDGMRVMFVMMNMARLSVGVQGLGVGERALQAAVEYAHERKQGRAPGAERGASSPIVDHPDVKRMLLTTRAQVEAMRLVCYLNVTTLDRARHATDPDEAQRLQELCDLLIPITKSWCTDLGVETTSTTLQVFGGMGYIEETGVAQYFRDARIAPIYEGTNGIQALDLVSRKMPMRAGAVTMEFLDAIDATAVELAKSDQLATLGAQLSAATDLLRKTVGWVFQNAANPLEVMAGATNLQEMFGLTTGAWMLGRAALVAEKMIADGTTNTEFTEAFCAEKMMTARYFGEQVLPDVFGLAPKVTAGIATIAASAI